jgi:isoquinoline 1-oxidoreductase beta subunit
VTGWIEARYHQPFLAHACMEPMTATVSVEADRVLVYAPTQSPKRSAEQVAAHLGRPVADIQMFNTYLGGGFGRKGLDFGATFQAATLSAQLGRPVQVIWDRETDIEQDQFRPAAAYRCRARLDEAGMPTDLELRIATQSLRKQLFPQFYHPEIVEVSPTPFPYEVPALEIRWCEAELPIRVGFWRAVHSSAHPFAIESFVDHLAHQAGQDPYRYRRALLSQKPRLRAVLDRVADLAGWGRTLPTGHGLGIACIEGWGSFCAQVAEVSVSATGFSVERIWVVADCGVVLCPGTVEAQLQGAVADVLGMVLAGGVTFDRGAAVQNNFHTYPMLRCHQMPEVTVSMVASTEAPGGVGELGVPCVAAAVANAVFAASGHRATGLPIRLPSA